ncbi:MAG: helix-turn-helix domain-containing protein [Actinomycetota bacterium]|nr:helix-turn-helix domain-containing protein [Actinomycetota bacterium]
MSDVVSANEAAQRFGLSEKTVRRWIAAGKLKADKSGRAYRVSLSEVAAINGHQNTDNGGPSPDSGQTADTRSAPATADSTSAMSGIAELVALIERLHGEVRQYAETAATWQTRAELLAHQLAAAEDRIKMLEAPKPEPVPEPIPPTPSAAPWWRRWLHAVYG